MTIKKLTDLLFKDIPLSNLTVEAREKVEIALEKAYQDELKNYNEIEALGNLMTRYSTVEAAGKLAGYSVEEIKRWSDEQGVDLKSHRKSIFLLKTFLLTGIFLCICAVTYVMNGFVYRAPMNMVCSAVCAVAGFFCLRKSRRVKSEIYNTYYDADVRKHISSQHDKYVKKTINTLIFSVAYVAYIVIVCVFLFQFKYPDTIQYVLSQNTVIDFILFLLIKNILLMTFYAFYCRENLEVIKEHIKTITVYTVLYFSVILVAMNFIAKKTKFVLNTYYVLAVIFGIAVLVYNFTLRKKLVHKNIIFNKRRVIAVRLCVVLGFSYTFMKMDVWLLQPFISSASAIEHQESDISYDENTGVYTITKKSDDFKILQLTDIHLGGSVLSYSKDHKALEAVYDLIAYTKPDFVMVTGDLVFPLGVMSYSFNNETAVIQFASFMRNIGIPWGFVYGNHESESMATLSGDELDKLFQSMSYKTSQTLLYPYVQPDIMGRNNQIIKIENMDGSLNQALFLLDSNDYINGGINEYDYIHDDQVKWYRENVEALQQDYGPDASSLAFFHIPLQEYKTAYDLYETGSKEVTYYFGEIGETMIDKICCSKYPSKFFDTAVSLRSTKAMFCGHDHYNNISLEYEGIRLTYGMSIDYLAMPGIENDHKQRGGTLITLHEDSSFDVSQVRLSDI